MILIVKAQIGETGPAVTVRGRDAWALLELKAANDNGCTPLRSLITILEKKGGKS